MSQVKEARVTAEEQGGDTVVETALAALNEDIDTDLEETDVQEILPAYKESRQLRGEQRVTSGYRPVTRRTSGGKPYRVEGRLNTHLSRENIGQKIKLQAMTFRIGNDETLAKTSLNAERRLSNSWDNRARWRSLWKGTAEFWTRDMPQDDTWRPNRHHSNILPLFRNHLTRNAVPMPPSLVNPVAQAYKHERRDSHLSVVSHTEDAEENRRRVVLRLPELSNVYITTHDDSSCATEQQDAAVEAANPGVNDKIPAKGCRIA